MHEHPAFKGEAAAHIERLATQTAPLDARDRLPLLSIAFPALRQRPPEFLRALATLLDALAGSDGRVEVFEYALVRLCRVQLYEVLAPRARRAPVVAPKLYNLRSEVQALFSVLAREGQADAPTARAAYQIGVARLLPTDPPEYAPTLQWDALDRALVRLDFLPPSMKAALIEALVATVMHDRQIVLVEAELLRVVCASVHCPMPPLAVQ